MKAYIHEWSRFDIYAGKNCGVLIIGDEVLDFPLPSSFFHSEEVNAQMMRLVKKLNHEDNTKSNPKSGKPNARQRTG